MAFRARHKRVAARDKPDDGPPKAKSKREYKPGEGGDGWEVTTCKCTKNKPDLTCPACFPAKSFDAVLAGAELKPRERRPTQVWVPEVKKVKKVQGARGEEDVNKAMIGAVTANAAKMNAALKSKQTQAECPGCLAATNKMLEDFAKSGLPSIPHWSGLMQGTTFSKKTSQASRCNTCNKNLCWHPIEAEQAINAA